jgi:hypothetical protein
MSKNFGSVPRGPSLTHSFVLRNTTGEELHVSNLRVSCGCVTVRAEKMFLKPGEETLLIATMDTTRFRGGRTVTIFVTFDQPWREEVRLSVRANSRDDVSVTPETLALGQVKRGSEASGSVRVTFIGNGNAHVTGVQADSNYVKPSVRELSRRDSEVTYEVTGSLRADTPVGRWFTDLWLTTDVDALPRVRVPLTVEIESPLSVSPAVVSLGDMKVGTVVERRVIVHGVRAFRVKELRGTDSLLSVSGTTEVSKPVHVLTIQFKAIQTGDVSLRATVVTDLDGGSIDIPVAGRVLK